MNRLLQDILNQPRSLSCVIDHHVGEGAEDLEHAGGIVRGSRNVIFTGMGSSLFAAIPAVCLLNDAGIAAEAVDSSELLYYRNGAMHRGTTVVLISRSGDSVETIKLLPLLRDKGAHAVALTNTEDSTLARELSSRILIGSDADQLVAIQSYSATLFVLLLLAMEAVDRRPSAPALTMLLESLQKSIDDNLGRSDKWPEFLNGAGAIYLLGRGPSMASVYESALMFNEAARVPSVGMSAAQFRHGPVEVVDHRFRGFVFASSEATLELDLALASDLAHLGAGIVTCTAPLEIAPFQPLVEIVPVQFAACRVAESRGITPGEFRYAGRVTTAESGFRGK